MGYNGLDTAIHLKPLIHLGPFFKTASLISLLRTYRCRPWASFRLSSVPRKASVTAPGTYLPLGRCWRKRLTGFTCRNTAGLSLLLRPVRKTPLSVEALRGNLTKTDWVTARKIRVYERSNSLAKATKHEANPDTRFLQAWGVSTNEQPRAVTGAEP